jgi:hypothetical protein
MPAAVGAGNFCPASVGIQGFGNRSLYFIIKTGPATVRFKLVVIPSEGKDKKENNN